MNSLRTRINLGVLTLSLIFFIGLVMAEGFFIRQVAEYYVSTRLQHDAEILLSLMEITPDSDEAAISLSVERTNPIYRRPLSGHYYKILIPDGQSQLWLRSRSLWDDDFQLPSPLPPLPTLLHNTGPQEQPLLIHVDRFEWQGKSITIAVAESLEELQPLIRRAQWWSAGVGGLVVLLLWMLFGRWLNLALAPLNELSAQISQLKRGVREQLTLQQPVQELQPVVAEVNALAQALDERISRSRKAMGNLAHALKTPLAVLRQLGCAGPEQGSEAWWHELNHNLDVIQLRIDNELKRARIAGQQGARRQLNLRDETLDLLATLQRIHSGNTINAEVNMAPHILLHADRHDFMELLGNLLDNAFKHARHRVKVSAALTPSLVISVEDDGRGCNEADLQRMQQRGKRLDESGSGHGLGLAIVQDIVAQYGAHCEFNRSALGGLRAAIHWPEQATETNTLSD